jgi:hypothetical protein
MPAPRQDPNVTADVLMQQAQQKQVEREWAELFNDEEVVPHDPPAPRN